MVQLKELSPTLFEELKKIVQLRIKHQEKWNSFKKKSKEENKFERKYETHYHYKKSFRYWSRD